MSTAPTEQFYRAAEIIARLVALLQRTVAKRIAIKPLVDEAVAAIQGTITIAADNDRALTTC